MSSYDGLGSIGFIPLGSAIAGPAADWFGVAETILAACATIVVATLLLLLIPEVRNLRRREPQAAADARSIAVS